MSNDKEHQAGEQSGTEPVDAGSADPADPQGHRGAKEPGAADSDCSPKGAEGEAGQENVGEDPSPEAEVERWKELALRCQADLDNFRKRMARDRQDALRYANNGLLESLLPILDNFEMGLEAARMESEESMIFQGMNMVLNQVRSFLEEQGVAEVEAEGQVFDPKTHEAVAQEASDAIPEGEIVRVTRRGYRLVGTGLLRAPAVVVSTGQSGSEGGDGEA